jgi:DNA-binding NtrC family response regulator
MSLNEATDQFQLEYIQRHVQAAGGNVAQAAERLGLHRSNLYRKMRHLGMETGE